MRGFLLILLTLALGCGRIDRGPIGTKITLGPVADGRRVEHQNGFSIVVPAGYESHTQFEPGPQGFEVITAFNRPKKSAAETLAQGSVIPLPETVDNIGHLEVHRYTGVRGERLWKSLDEAAIENWNGHEVVDTFDAGGSAREKIGGGLHQSYGSSVFMQQRYVRVGGDVYRLAFAAHNRDADDRPIYSAPLPQVTAFFETLETP